MGSFLPAMVILGHRTHRTLRKIYREYCRPNDDYIIMVSLSMIQHGLRQEITTLKRATMTDRFGTIGTWCHVVIVIALALLFLTTMRVEAYAPLGTHSSILNVRPVLSETRCQLKSQADSSAMIAFDDAVSQRYACTRYQRYDNVNTTTTESASPPDPFVLKQAMTVLDLARRAPTGFNAQPYKLLVVSSPDAKLKLAKYCIGHNAHRVRDSDCTVLFLADRQVMREWNNYRKYLLLQSSSNSSMTRMKLLKIRVLIGMFSSGLPLPHILSGPISFAFRLAMRVLSWIVCQPFHVLVKLPTLSGSQTWSEKNTMLVAMSYLLGCSARNIATTPMEGYLTWGIRRSLGIPRRYTIPMIVATGRPFVRNTTTTTTFAVVGKDDAGLTHGNTKGTSSPRFPSNMTIFKNEFGTPYSSSRLIEDG